jgi:hypothetical protein
MDFKKLIPDFSAIGKTNWGKPNLDTKNPMWLLMAGAALLMVVFTFISWQTVTAKMPPFPVAEATTMGITTWFGVIAFIATIVAIYGILYKQTQFAFCGAIVAAICGLIGCLMIVDGTSEGVDVTVAQIKEAKADIAEAQKYGAKGCSFEISHLGAILFLVASLVLAGASFLQIKKENE